MMADANDRGKDRGRIWVVLASFVVVAIVIWVTYSRSRRPRKPIGVVVRQIEQGDEIERVVALQGLYSDLSGPDDLAQVFPVLIRAMKSESMMLREAAASDVGGLIMRFGARNGPGIKERDPAIVALCPEAEKALAALLDESSPTRGCDLRLMATVPDASGIPTAGKRLVVVADVGHVLHFRIFDADGKTDVDADERRLPERAAQFLILKKRLESLWPPHELTRGEKDEVIADVAAIVYRTADLRATAARSLGKVAEVGKLDAPPPRLVACLDDESDPVRIAAAGALIWYRQGPEWLVPVALRRLPGEKPHVREAFTEVFWFVRLEPSVLPVLIEGLSSENTEVRLSCTAAINHMGRDARPALPNILTLIRKELETPPRLGAPVKERIIGMAAGAVGELSPDTEPQPGTVELLCAVLKRPLEAVQASDANLPVSSITPQEALKLQGEFRQAEAAWSLGILGRFATSATPLMLSTFEATRATSDELRGALAESLAETSRGTPDEDRVIASLANASKTESREQKTSIARALRRLGPKAEQLVPDIRQLPADEAGSRIRRVRYPRSRRGQPVRE